MMDDVQCDSLRILRLATPLALIQLAQVAISTTDLIVLGASHTTALAAGALGFAIFNLIRTMGFGLLVGASNLVARSRDLAVDIFWATALIASRGAVVAVGAVASLIPFLQSFNGDPAVTNEAKQYLWAIAPGYPPLFLFYACRGVLVGQERANGLLVVMLCIIGINAFLNIGFMFGRFGLPELGVFGVALASSICFTFQACVAAALLFRGAKDRSASAPDVTRHAVPLLTIGIPTAATYGSEAGFSAVLAIFAGWLGTHFLAAHAIVNQLTYIAFMLSIGLSHAASVLVSGADSAKSRRRFGLCGAGLGIAISLVFAVNFLLFPTQLTRIFLRDDLSAESVVLLLMPIAATIFPFDFDFLQNINIGAVRAVDRAGTGLAITAASYWILGAPVAWILAFSLGLGLNGVWLGDGLGLLIASTALVALFLRQTRSQEH